MTGGMRSSARSAAPWRQRHVRCRAPRDRRARGSPRPASEPHPCARRSCEPSRADRAVRRHGGEGRRHGGAARRRRTTFPTRSPPISAATICRSRSAPAPIRSSPACPGTASRIWSDASARPTARDLVAVSRAFAGVAETGTLVLTLRRRQSDDAEFPARHAHRRPPRRRYRRRLRDRLRPPPHRARRRGRCRAR